MKNKFGILAKIKFLQTLASKLISKTSPAVIHNIEKYIALKKVSFLTSIESIEGDYIEFGVFQGSSFIHSIRCWISHRHFAEHKKMKFIGFDSFDGFGDLEKDDSHPFYRDESFITSYDYVLKKVKKASKGIEFKLVKGFFQKTLKESPSKYGIHKAKIIFIDSDTFSSAENAFSFCKSIIQNGTYIIIDDFFSYRGSANKGVSKAFYSFKEITKTKTRHVMNYGNGGSVFVVTD